MTRLYAHALSGERAVDSTPVNTPSSTTILSSIQINGSTTYTTYQDGTTAEKFAEYLKAELLPRLDRDAVIILEQSGCRYLYLPPYSPDLNPIEKL